VADSALAWITNKGLLQRRAVRLDARCQIILDRRLLVTRLRVVTDDHLVFKALTDPTRRFLLDRLFEGDGATLSEFKSDQKLTRFGVMKHLRLLKDAGLVVTRRSSAGHQQGELALPQRGADSADPRSVDRQVRRTPRRGAGRPQDRAGEAATTSGVVGAVTNLAALAVAQTCT